MFPCGDVTEMVLYLITASAVSLHNSSETCGPHGSCHFVCPGKNHGLEPRTLLSLASLPVYDLRLEILKASILFFQFTSPTAEKSPEREMICEDYQAYEW